MSAVIVRLFGPPCIERDGRRVDVDTRKAIALLAYLALAARPVSRASLAALLWPEYDQSRASANLRRTLWSLNAALGEGMLDTAHEQVALAAAPGLQVDVLEFGRLLAEAAGHRHRADQSCPACRAPLAAAAALARDEFMAGFALRDAVEFDDWQALTAAGLREALAGALGRLADAHCAAGDVPAALEAARRRAALDPLDQRAARELMQLYAWADQHAAALRVYRELERRLAAELRVAPEADVAELFEAIKARREPPPPNAAPEPGAPAPLAPDVLGRADAASPLFVARERELAALGAHLEEVRAGRGRVVFVAGEAGQGKTALLGAFARAASAAHPDLVCARGSCNAYTGAGDPYLPFRDVLELITGRVEEAARAGSLDRRQAERLWRLMPHTAQALCEHGPDLLGTLVPLRPLLARGAGALDPATRRALEDRAARPATFDPTLQQASLFEQLCRTLASLARRAPLVLMLDDLQWGDAGSLALLFHLSRRLAGVPILVLAAYRPSDVALGRGGERHPLESIIHEVQRAQGASTVDLAQAEGRAFVDALLDSEPNRLGAAFRDELFRQTGGHPLFTSELLRGMQERGDLVRDESGAWAALPALDWERLPARVEAVIAERIARLPAELGALLRAACVEGEEFSAEVAARLAGVPEAEARRRLSGELEREHRLVRAIGVQRVGGARLTRYRFHHFLIQRGLYAGLDAAERVAFGEDAGLLLEQIYAGQTEEVAVALARHFEAAELPDRAVAYYRQAGDRALRLSANAEAADLYGRALALLTSQPATPERLQQELALQAAFSVPVQHLEGWASPRADAAFERALELARLFGSPPPTHPLLGRIAHALVYRGEHRRAMPLAQEMLALASAAEDEATLLEAHTVVGLTHFYLGQFAQAQPHLDQALRLYDPAAHAHLTYLYGQDAGVHAGLYRMLNLTMLGYVDQARAQAAETVALAERVGHPFTLAFTWSFVALAAGLALDIDTVLDASDRSLAVAEAHAFPTWQAFSLSSRGVARVARGEPELGYAEAMRGLEIALPTGAQTVIPFILGLASHAHVLTGAYDDALGLLDVAQQLAAHHDEGMSFADLHRRRGELLLLMGRPWSEADESLRRAADVARGQGARLHELRALAARARLARAHAPAEAEQARAALAAAYAWFTEGFDAADLVAARAELARG